MFSLICARINGWLNNGEAGDMRLHRAHYDVIVMYLRFKTSNQLILPSVNQTGHHTYCFVVSNSLRHGLVSGAMLMPSGHEPCHSKFLALLSWYSQHRWHIILMGVYAWGVSACARVSVYKRDHDDVIKWKHFPRYWPFVWGEISRWISHTKASDAELSYFLWSAPE